MRFRGRARGTIEKSARQLARFVAFIDLEARGTVTGEAVLAFLHSRDVADQTKASDWRAVRAFLNWLAANVPGAPVEMPPGFSPRFRPAPKRLAPSPERVQELIRTMPRDTVSQRRNHAIAATIYCSGCRVSEAVAVERAHVSFEARAFQAYSPKRNEYQLKPLPLALAAVLADWAGNASGSRWLFPCYDNGADGLARHVSKRVFQDAWHAHAPDVWPHDLRRAFASHFGLGLPDLMACLGHHEPRTTMGYVSLSMKNINRTLDSAERFEL